MKFNKISSFLLLALSLHILKAENNGFGLIVTNGTCETNDVQRALVISQVTQRFYAYQDATSAVKRVGHAADPTLLQTALDVLVSFIDPNFTRFAFDTSIQFQFNSIAEFRGGYQFFATSIFNGFSQHFADNVVVTPIAGSNCLQARMTSGGGEWASLNPAQPNEQITISNWEIIWTFLPNGPVGPNWYITDYLEIGNRLYRICPPTGPISLAYSRTFTGATPEANVDYICTGSTSGPISAPVS